MKSEMLAPVFPKISLISFLNLSFAPKLRVIGIPGVWASGWLS